MSVCGSTLTDQRPADDLAAEAAEREAAMLELKAAFEAEAAAEADDLRPSMVSGRTGFNEAALDEIDDFRLDAFDEAALFIDDA